MSDDSREVEAASEDIQVQQLPAVKEWCPTGCTVLDLAIANQFPGGVPIGRIVHIFGAGSTCKTVLATTVLGYAQRSKRKAYFADVEHTLDPAFAKLYGLDCDEKLLSLGYPKTLEEFFDEYLAGIIVPKGLDKKLNTASKIIVVDSMTALPAALELKEAMEDATYGMVRAKQMSKGFRKYISALANSNTTLFCVDQTRDNVGGYGAKETTSGGRALEFYSSVQIYLKHDTKIVNSSMKTIGIWVHFRIDKNKVGPPFREGRFRILFDYGLDDISSSLYFISEIQSGDREAKKLSTKIKLFGKEITLSSWAKYVEENNLEEELRKEVWNVWQKAYETESRKSRVW